MPPPNGRQLPSPRAVLAPSSRPGRRFIVYHNRAPSALRGRAGRPRFHPRRPPVGARPLLSVAKDLTRPLPSHCPPPVPSISSPGASPPPHPARCTATVWCTRLTDPGGSGFPGSPKGMLSNLLVRKAAAPGSSTLKHSQGCSLRRPQPVSADWHASIPQCPHPFTPSVIRPPPPPCRRAPSPERSEGSDPPSPRPLSPPAGATSVVGTLRIRQAPWLFHGCRPALRPPPLARGNPAVRGSRCSS
jgi:hypothetical protein